MTKRVVAFAINFSEDVCEGRSYRNFAQLNEALIRFLTTEIHNHKPTEVKIYDISTKQPADGNKSKRERLISQLQDNLLIAHYPITYVRIDVVDYFQKAYQELLSESSHRSSSHNVSSMKYSTPKVLKSVQDGSLLALFYLYSQDAAKNLAEEDSGYFYLITSESTNQLPAILKNYNKFIPQRITFHLTPFDHNPLLSPRITQSNKGDGIIDQNIPKILATICFTILKLKKEDFENKTFEIKASKLRFNTTDYANFVALRTSSLPINTDSIKEPLIQFIDTKPLYDSEDVTSQTTTCPQCILF